jgi:triacylglycerol lipase
MKICWTLKRRRFNLLIAAVACLWAVAPAHAANDPPLTVPQSQLDSALQCDEFTHRDRPPVLFVHGAFATGPEEWDWTTRPELGARGFDTCVVTLPDRIVGSDLQVAAEYVVNAVRRMYREGDRRKVAVVGHSAGPPVARWALRWWRGVRKRVADFVSLAGINHGAGLEASSLSGTALMTPMMWQLSLDSRFLQALNGDEAPGRVDYTAIYTRYDVFQLPPHEGRAALALGEGRANVSNILIQDVCPGMLTEHFSLITDASVYSLIVDALLHDGPASVARSGAREACTASPLNPSALAAFDRLARELPGILEDSIANGPPELPLVSEEPPLKPYVGSGPRRKRQDDAHSPSR